MHKIISSGYIYITHMLIFYFVYVTHMLILYFVYITHMLILYFVYVHIQEGELIFANILFAGIFPPPHPRPTVWRGHTWPEGSSLPGQRDHRKASSIPPDSRRDIQSARGHNTHSWSVLANICVNTKYSERPTRASDLAPDSTGDQKGSMRVT